MLSPVARAIPCIPAKARQCHRVPGTLIPLRQATFWLAVIHAVASSSHGMLAPVALSTPQPLSLHRDNVPTRRAVALHPTTAFANQTAQTLLRACDPHSKPTPAMSPTSCMTPRVSPPDTSSVTQPHHVQLCFFFFFPSPLLPPSLGRALGVLWGRKRSERGISPYQHRAAPKRKFLEVARVRRHAQGW